MESFRDARWYERVVWNARRLRFRLEPLRIRLRNISLRHLERSPLLNAVFNRVARNQLKTMARTIRRAPQSSPPPFKPDPYSDASLLSFKSALETWRQSTEIPRNKVAAAVNCLKAPTANDFQFRGMDPNAVERLIDWNNDTARMGRFFFSNNEAHATWMSRIVAVASEKLDSPAVRQIQAQGPRAILTPAPPPYHISRFESSDVLERYKSALTEWRSRNSEFPRNSVAAAIAFLTYPTWRNPEFSGLDRYEASDMMDDRDPVRMGLTVGTFENWNEWTALLAMAVAGVDEEDATRVPQILFEEGPYGVLWMSSEETRNNDILPPYRR